MIPSSQSTLSVKLINPVNAGPSRLHRFMAPAVPGMETHDNFPSFSFLLEHAASGRKLVWDLGIRKDYQNYSPKIASYIPTTGYTIQVEKNVADILAENGVRGEDVEAVIWRYFLSDAIDLTNHNINQDYNAVTGTGTTSAIHPPSPRLPTSSWDQGSKKPYSQGHPPTPTPPSKKATTRMARHTSTLSSQINSN